MADLIALKAELDADPLARGYAGMTDSQAADDINAVIRPGAANQEELLNAVALTRHASGNGNDSAPTNVYGRLSAMSMAAVGVDVFGQGNQPQQAQLSTAQDIHAASTFSWLLGNPDIVELNLRSAELQLVLDDLVRGEVISTAASSALEALSDNKQSRGQELGLGTVIEGDVLAARNL